MHPRAGTLVSGEPSPSSLASSCWGWLSSAQLRVLGAVLGFASTAFYPVPLADQQIAAGIVMVPGVITDLVVLTVCLYLWLSQDDRSQAGRGDRGGRPAGFLIESRRA